MDSTLLFTSHSGVYNFGHFGRRRMLQPCFELCGALYDPRPSHLFALFCEH